MEFTPTNYSKKERQDLIINEINIHTRITYDYLSQKLGVSEDTIRRDINELADNKNVVKIKGGVMSNSYQHFNSNHAALYGLELKKKIAEKLLTLIKSDMILLLGGGTTISEFIKLIPNNFSMTVFTVNLYSAIELLDKPNITTIFLGGQISTFSQMSIGSNVIMRLYEIKPDLCIIGANAIDLNYGLSDSDYETVEVKKAMIEVSKSLAILSISEKLNSEMRFKIGDCSKINYLITEKAPNDPVFENFKDHFPLMKII